MNIYNYIDNYGIYSFEEKPFNEVDNVIFSFLSYADFKSILEDNNMTIEKAAYKHLKLHNEKDNNIIAVKEGNKLLRYLKDKKRYKDCLLKHYEYITDNKTQFKVISIEYLKNHIYISFEGTDELLSGWMENLMLSYKSITNSHKQAINYLNKHYTFTNKHLIIGGHSKGGNIALIASLYVNPLVKRQIKEITNVDGPGLLDRDIKSKRYLKIKNKYTHIIPNYSLVGLFLNNTNEIVVSSTNKGILSHNIVYWEIDNNKFKRTNLSEYSNRLKIEINEWFNKYNNEDKLEFINNLEEIFTKANITSILDLKDNYSNIIKLIYESKNINESTKNVIKDFISILINSFNDTKREEIKNFVTTMFKIK